MGIFVSVLVFYFLLVMDLDPKLDAARNIVGSELTELLTSLEELQGRSDITGEVYASISTLYSRVCAIRQRNSETFPQSGKNRIQVLEDISNQVHQAIANAASLHLKELNALLDQIEKKFG